MRKWYICGCACHDMAGVYHIMACCYKCPICEIDIITLYFEEHIYDCEENIKEFHKCKEFSH
jgi:hypothetical protein